MSGRLETSPQAILTTFTFPAALSGENVSLLGSFNDWGPPISMRQISSGGDFVRSVVLPPGLVEYKFTIDGVWRHSPRDAIKVDAELSSINNRKVVDVNSRVTWRSTGAEKEVYMAGSFLAWAEIVPLTKRSNGYFEADCCFPYGKHHIRFLVDNEWRLSPDMPTETSEDGEQCNVIEVEARDSFHICCETGWRSATLRQRMLDEDSEPTTDWTDVPMIAMQSTLKPWKGCDIPAPRGPDNKALPCNMEFVITGPDGKEDRPYGGGTYKLLGAGGYKLSQGVVRPFPQASCAPIMLVSDVDGTMIDDSDSAARAAADFREYWENTAALCSSIMVYNTGRSIGQLTGLLEHRRDCMVVPDAIITAVGTKVFLLNRKVTRSSADPNSWEEDPGWSRLLDEHWNLDAVREAGSRCIQDRVNWLDQGTEHPHRVALSVHRDEIDRVVSSIRRDVEDAGWQAQYIVSGMGEYLYLDVLSIRAGKRNAMDYVRRLFGISRERVVAAGDSGNDVLMLEGDTPGIVVGNAQPSLISWAVTQKQHGDAQTILTDKPLAHGILEGLARHGLY